MIPICSGTLNVLQAALTRHADLKSPDERPFGNPELEPQRTAPEKGDFAAMSYESFPSVSVSILDLNWVAFGLNGVCS